MDLPPQPPPTVRVHGSEIQAPTGLQPNRIGKQSAPQLTNGVLKRQKHPPVPVTLFYGKCIKNYAATTGGQVLDGCGEFMPSPTTSSLQCDACGCHRSFHRLEADHFHQTVPQVIECQCQQQHRQPPSAPPPSCLAGMAKSSSTPPDSQSPPPISSSYYPAAPHMFLALNPGLPPPEPTNNNHPSILTPAVATRPLATQKTEETTTRTTATTMAMRSALMDRLPHLKNYVDYRW
ncbi:hypothetical protein L2E82_33442 [Cichorium intybus]|uniref:Uncharacterized protein n=1 Tax=Cichorium intybus TaxID=13427 RepID=A0ACB9BK44_CICIN|nr:hypothetical protein L2E82_33442 [Cichorium intybus]